LPTGVRLDPVGQFIDLGNLPLGMALSPGRDKLAVVLSGWREQGLQIVDVASRRVTQTLSQPAAFYGVAFSPDGKMLYASGGNEDAIFCYSWRDGVATFDRKIILGEKKLVPGERAATGSRYPAGIAVGKKLYVAENVGDAVAVIDPTTSRIEQRLPTDHYPYAVELAPDGYLYVSAWGANTISIFRVQDDGRLMTVGRLSVGRHPSALVANKSGSRLYVALAGTDTVAAIDTRRRKILEYLNDAAPAGPSEGSTPNALALSPDGSTLFVAEADNNAVAVFDVSGALGGTAGERKGKSGILPKGRVPTDWYPTAVLHTGRELLVLNAKGHGTRANPNGPIPGLRIPHDPNYVLGQLNGTVRIIDPELKPATLTGYSRRVAVAGGWDQPRPDRRYPPFKHVVYIIKENRTYDQVFGDIKEGDGDASLVFFGESVTPNHHALARRFGLFDRFFTNAEVSSQGHIWSTAAYVTDYGEKTVESSYSDRRPNIDAEEIDEPANGFLWNLAVKQGVTFRDYGEMVSGPEKKPVGERGLGADVNPQYAPFDLSIPDQRRADAWLAEFQEYEKAGNMPQLEILHLPNDHTAGGRPGFCTPRACVADNDLALGRIIEALTHSSFWRDTVVFVVEDDAQNGRDHVDSHRAPFFVLSAYNRPGTVHRFANTTDVVAAIEDILGLGRMSKFDYFSRSLA
ncbi:MAG: bifunctional YncE family protein/alkaline phosphatase family protein, partial [Acidobacteriaceae bacterium]|nr:bifunctional YncE family protein/alkaline phosphatase family protein [Acidobacteriaceae bacterium]